MNDKILIILEFLNKYILVIFAQILWSKYFKISFFLIKYIFSIFM